MSDFRNFHSIIIQEYGDTFLKKFQKFRLFIEELYARIYNWYMFEALSLLVY